MAKYSNTIDFKEDWSFPFPLLSHELSESPDECNFKSFPSSWGSPNLKEKKKQKKSVILKDISTKGGELFKLYIVSLYFIILFSSSSSSSNPR